MSVKQITTGQDSFLDIVANLVGVLIILVVVVGAQAKTAWQPTEPPANLENEIQEARSRLDLAGDQVHKLEVDNRLLEEQIEQESAINIDLSAQRHQMMVQLQIVEQQLVSEKQQRLDQLTAQQQSKLARLEEQQKLEIRLAEIESAANAVSAASQPKTEVIEHFPNPIAKTVFAEEIHFQLKAGKLSFVPLDQLVGRMKAEWKVNAEKLEQANHTIETVGPIGNFRLQYELAAENVSQTTRYGNVERKAIRFDGFTIIPNFEEMGDDLATALQSNSEFRDVLRRHQPGKTTVSIWIYPDSYPTYNELKKWLYEQGYQIACWPLDEGRRISGGPNGFRSSAQ